MFSWPLYYEVASELEKALTGKRKWSSKSKNLNDNNGALKVKWRVDSWIQKREVSVNWQLR